MVLGSDGLLGLSDRTPSGALICCQMGFTWGDGCRSERLSVSDLPLRLPAHDPR